eukprot:5360230-Amphidinium_carterae.2
MMLMVSAVNVLAQGAHTCNWPCAKRNGTSMKGVIICPWAVIDLALSSFRELLTQFKARTTS